jgi:hypothetical protein
LSCTSSRTSGNIFFDTVSPTNTPGLSTSGSSSSQRFTVSQSGTYLVSFTLQAAKAPQLKVSVDHNGGPVYTTGSLATTDYQLSGQCLVSCLAGDNMSLAWTEPLIGPSSSFSDFLSAGPNTTCATLVIMQIP